MNAEIIRLSPKTTEQSAPNAITPYRPPEWFYRRTTSLLAQHQDSQSLAKFALSLIDEIEMMHNDFRKIGWVPGVAEDACELMARLLPGSTDHLSGDHATVYDKRFSGYQGMS